MKNEIYNNLSADQKSQFAVYLVITISCMEEAKEDDVKKAEEKV